MKGLETTKMNSEQISIHIIKGCKKNQENFHVIVLYLYQEHRLDPSQEDVV